jgi:hypothetical protein
MFTAMGIKEILQRFAIPIAPMMEHPFQNCH